MNTLEKNDKRHSSVTYLALRQWLGILGLALPFLLWGFNDFELKSSISHFYYSNSSIIFTGFMMTFGIFLIFYPGRNDKTDKISDKWITSIGGFGAILTALIPTAYFSECPNPLLYTIELKELCAVQKLTTPHLHNNAILGGIHLSCAAIFLILMGYMSFARFTKGSTSAKMKLFYRFCAVLIWIPLLVLGITMGFKLDVGEYMVFICECISLGFFGIAWLVKGKTFKRFGFH